jgi:hypothetical protein
VGDGSWFLYRCPYQGPPAVLVRRLADKSPLAWFHRVWEATADTVRIHDQLQAHRWVDRHLAAELGADVYGLAYFFLDDALVRSAPDRLAYLMLGDWRLPAAIGPGRSTFRAPFPIRTLARSRPGTGTTWLVVLDTDVGEFGDTPPVAFAGIRLPDLPELLRTVVPAHTEPRRRSRDPWSGWSWEPLALRALLAPGDRSIGPALRRYNRRAWQPNGYESVTTLRRTAEEPHADAHATLARFLDELPPERASKRHRRDPALSRIRAGRHLLQAAIHVDRRLSYERW